MESPVVVDKPPEYHGNTAKPNDRGFPFDEEEGSGAWSELAARHPDIAARLRQRPATWARKRRPSSHDADDFGDNFGGFDRFPFDDIPQEFREHFPSHWNRRFGPRDEPQPSPQAAHVPPAPQQQTTATQTEQDAGSSQQQAPLPQYGLRNTVDLGQKSPADPSLVNADDRNQRSMSAPPESRTANQNCTNKMSGQNHHQEQQHQPQAEQQSSNVRHIPIFVEGRDEPVINKSVDHGAHFGDTKPTFVPPPPPPQQPHVDREQYFEDGPTFHHPPNFGRTFGTPFNKGFRQGPQPFVQQKVYPQNAFARGASPQRSQSPKPQMHPEEHFVKVPVYHEQPAASKPEPPRPQPKQSPQQHQPPPPQQQQQQHQQQQQQHQHQQQHQQQHQPSPPHQEAPQPPKPQQQTPANDPITQILHIQTDVLNLMTDVENFCGTKKDKKYLYLDEMLTRNLIKLDNIETDGKENIRQARKEAIRCIQKCIAVLEAKAEKGNTTPQPQTQDVEMNENSQQNEQTDEQKEATENGEVEMKEVTKEEEKAELKVEKQISQPANEQEKKGEQKPQAEEDKEVTQPQQDNKETVQENKEANKDGAQPQTADTRLEDDKTPEQKTDNKQEEQNNQENPEKKPSAKKGTKVVKKRDKSKDKKEASKDSSKEKGEQNDKKKEKVDEKSDEKKSETMQIDEKGDKTEAQTMEVDGASASQ